MAGPNLSLTPSGSSGHIAAHGAIADVVNMFDKDLVPNNGDVLTWNSTSTLYEPEAPSAGSNPFGSLFVTLSSFAGADSSAKFRQALSDLTGDSPMPILLIPPGTTLDSGANNPFILPTGIHVMCAPLASTDEFGFESTINIRHTGSTTTLGVFKWANGSSSQHFTGITFKGTSTTRAFVDNDLAGADSNNPTYVVFNGVSFNQFESIGQWTGTGCTWHGGCYLNNMAATSGKNPLYWAGSDHNYFTNGGFFEMGAVATYATRVACTAMLRGGSLSNTGIGSIYWTGSPTTIFRLNGGSMGVHFTQAILEGRPVPSTTEVNHAGGNHAITGGLHCAGPLARLDGGGAVFLNREHGYAMRDPNAVGYNAGGFYHITGGDHVIHGGAWNPYTAATYDVAWTMPNGGTYPAATIPPFVWVTTTSARVNIAAIQWGSNAAGVKPKVYVPTGYSTDNIITDNSVQVVTF